MDGPQPPRFLSLPFPNAEISRKVQILLSQLKLPPFDSGGADTGDGPTRKPDRENGWFRFPRRSRWGGT